MVISSILILMKLFRGFLIMHHSKDIINKTLVHNYFGKGWIDIQIQ